MLLKFESPFENALIGVMLSCEPEDNIKKFQCIVFNFYNFSSIRIHISCHGVFNIIPIPNTITQTIIFECNKLNCSLITFFIVDSFYRLILTQSILRRD